MLDLPHRIEKVVSGGQTGADKGGLLGASDRKLPTGGWAPKGFITENGPAPDLADFGLLETASSEYPDRTERNVKMSDGTVIFDVAKKYSGGSALTERLCGKHTKPCFIVRQLGEVMYGDNSRDVTNILNFINLNNIRVLNVAGNRESNVRGLQEKVRAIIKEVITKQNTV